MEVSCSSVNQNLPWIKENDLETFPRKRLRPGRSGAAAPVGVAPAVPRACIDDEVPVVLEAQVLAAAVGASGPQGVPAAVDDEVAVGLHDGLSRVVDVGVRCPERPAAGIVDDQVAVALEDQL